MRGLGGPSIASAFSFFSKSKQRFAALFLLAVMFLGTFLPSVSAYAQYRPNTDNPGIRKDDRDRNKKMKQAYPGGMKPTAATTKAAADTKPVDPKAKVKESKAVMGEALRGITALPKITPHEKEDKRTATSSVSVNEDGSLTEKHYMVPKHFQKEGKWEVIDTKLIEDKNAGDAGSAAGRALGNVRSWVSGETTYKVKDNDWQARFAPSDAKDGLLRVGKGDSQVGFAAVGAKKGVNPIITTASDGKQTVHYYDLWPGVNVDYVVESGAVKENVIIKDKNATNKVAFKVLGANIEKRQEKQKVGNEEITLDFYAIKGALNEEFAIAPANLILNRFGFVSEQSVFEQSYSGGEIKLSLDREYLRNLPDEAFPAVIDPGVFNSSFGTRAGGNYVSFKTDGYVCPANVCNLYAGSLYDSNWNLQHWRGAFFAPYEQFRNSNNVLTHANLHITQRSNESFWTGDWGHGHTYDVGHATCLHNFNCVDGSWAEAHFAHIGDINVTNLYQAMIAGGDFGAWMMVMGEDGSDHSFKNIDPNNTYVTFTYGGPLPAPSIETPTANQVYVDPQASFKVSPLTNPNNNNPLQYEFLISTGPGGSGAVIASGKSHSLQWTVPDGILQDGLTYYIQAQSYDSSIPVYSNWGTSVPFRIDTRTGKDKTQTYDTLGPIDVDLATGNVTTSASSHTSAALGGSLGVSLDYNTPLKSRSGLVGEYWNIPENHPGTVPTSAPNVTRVDQNIDFGWDIGSPAGGIGTDWFFARWSGYFVAPKTGQYYFGGRMDDLLRLYVNDTYLNNMPATTCYTAVCYGDPVTLQEGQIVPFRAEYEEATSPAYTHVWVKGAVDEQILPQAWLQTGVRPVTGQRGLTGRYYARNDGTNTFSTGNPMVMQRTDPYLSFNWGTGPPVSNGPADFLVRWTGYVTAPVTGTYTFGSRSDDGTKIMLGTSNTVVMNDWNGHGAPATPIWGNAYLLTAGTPVPITIEYFEQGGPGSFELWIKSQDISERITPSDWLSPKAQVLPDGWNLGLDPDGDINYDHIQINQNSVVLSDSTGSTHEYTWTGSGYKPPVNEDGRLVRNVDGTYTLQDSDGRTYVFAQDGTLSSLTSAIDDRKPAALQYEYQSQNGGPSHLWRIKDGVDPSRMATVYYSGDSECGNAPSGFDANAPGGMICALKTNDGRATYFYYIQAQLARIAEPDNELTDYQYETVSNGSAIIGCRMVSVRDVVTNDAIAGGVRTNDDNVKTQMAYDILGRVTSVTQPAATSGASRMQHTIEYLPGALDKSYHGQTKQHIAGSAEPHGFSRRVKYDSLFRTIEDTDIANLSDVTEWDPTRDMMLSATDEAGQRSTTIYDDEDRPVDSYGPAPTAWFGADRKPLTAYTGQVPRTESKYDENIVGPAVAWHDYHDTDPYSLPGGSFMGAPKLHTTGINPANPGTMSADLTNPPFPPTSGMAGFGLSATGKLRLPAGTYWLNVDTAEGVRIWIDDILVVDKWEDAAFRGITGGSFTVAAGQVKRFRMDTYRKYGSTGAFNVWMKQDWGFDWTTNWTNYLKPGYSLATSTKAYDSTLGASITATNFGANPELGLAQSSTVDAGGLNLATTNTHEQQGATGSFLRQTSKNLPGNPVNNPSFKYDHYTATDTRDNPCTPATEAYKQAGFMKLKTEADPDGAGSQAGRTTENIYDESGRVVATRINQDDWTCTAYDARGRVTQTTIPAFNNQPARTITNNYAVWGDPMITGVEDSAGQLVTGIDLLGRTIYYHDAAWNETWTQYDNQGRLSSRTSPLGTETFVYDNYNRLSEQKLDNVTYAKISYDQYSRTDKIDYPAAGNMRAQVGRDALGRLSQQTYSLDGNLIPNPSLESATGNPATPESWRTDHWGTNTANYTYATEGRTGSRSARTDMTAYTNGDAKWMLNDPIAVTPNTTYNFSDYYKSDIPNSVNLRYTHQGGGYSYHKLVDLPASSTWAQGGYNFTTPADVDEIVISHVIEAVGYLQVDDANLHVVGVPWTLSDAVTRSQSGQVVSGTENGQAKAYTYDNADRLISATIGSNTYTYGFGAQHSSCAADTNPNSGKNSNRTTQTVNSVTTTYCYDYADRLVSSSNPLVSDAQYDGHGNTTLIGSGSLPLQLTYDSSDRNSGIEQYTQSGIGSAVYYGRDTQNRITYRESDTITNWNWTVDNQQWYGFSGAGDSPDFVRNSAWQVYEKYLQLPGGVLVTIKPNEPQPADQKTYSLPNLHGDTMATTNASGAMTGTYAYDPFGNKVSANLPSNTAPDSTFGWVGQHQKITETDMPLSPIQMGARLYIPTLGRFLSVDPVEGGVENSYVYPPDTVNELDLDGQIAFAAIAAAALDAASFTYSANEFRKKPSWSNAGWLATEAIPFIPGAGLIRGGSKAPKAVKAVPKAVKKVPQAVKRVVSKVPKIAIHGPHHSWPRARGINNKVWMRHVQIIRRTAPPVRLPFGPMYKYKHGFKGPKGKIWWR